MKFFFKLTNKISVVFIVCFVSSCSLVKIENEQIPLSKTDLNTRLLTQAFVQDASKKVEVAADSILKLSKDVEIQKNALKWKINTLSALRSVGYQTSPNIALMDTWVITSSIKDYFSEQTAQNLFGTYNACIKV